MPVATDLERAAGWGLTRRGRTVRAWIGDEVIETPSDRSSLGVAFVANGARFASPVTPNVLWDACSEGSTCAFAFWDAEAGTLRWARDWLGGAALFGCVEGADFVVGGSCLAVARMAGRTDIDGDVVRRLYRGDFGTEATVLSGVVRAPRVPFPEAAEGDVRNAPDALLQAIRESVAAILESSSRLACQLSGGIDSATIAAVAVAEARRLGKPDPVLLTASYPGLPEDETDWARRVAGHLGAPWIVRAPSSRVPVDEIPDRTRQYGGPMIDPEDEEIAALHRAARAEGCDTVLTGHGAEILLGGRGLEIDLLRRGRIDKAWRLVRSKAEAGHMDAARMFVRGSVRQALRRRPLGVDRTTVPGAHDLARALSRIKVEGPLLLRSFEMGCRTADVAGVTLVHPLFSRRVWDVVGRVSADALFGDGTVKALLRRSAHGLLPPEVVGRVAKARHNHTHRARHEGARDRWIRSIERLREELGPDLGPRPDLASSIDRFFRTSEGMFEPWVSACVGEYVRQALGTDPFTIQSEERHERPPRRFFVRPGHAFTPAVRAGRGSAAALHPA